MTHPIKWVTLDTMDGIGSLKQHAFKPRDSKMPWTHEEYPGNVSLCGNVHASSAFNEELQEDFMLLNNELKREDCCKKCNQIASKIPKQ